MEDAFSKLTDGQRTCLRLVAVGLTSKEIARETGLSYNTVDQYLSRATALLGAANRREAARMYVAWEEFKKAELKPHDLANAGPSAILEPSANPRGWPQARSREHVMHDVAASDSVPGAAVGWHSAVPPIGGEANDLTLAERLYAVLRIAGISVIAMSAIVLVLTGILSLYG